MPSMDQDIMENDFRLLHFTLVEKINCLLQKSLSVSFLREEVY